MSEQKVVQLAGTNEWGVEERDQWWTTVTYPAKTPEPSAHDAVGEALADLKDEITAYVCRLSEMLARLRRLEVEALDGDEDAIEQAEAMLEGRTSIDDETICDMECEVEALQDLVEAHVEEPDDVTVDAGAIDSTIRDIALPHIQAGDFIQVMQRDVNLQSHLVTGAIIRTRRRGRYVTVTVFPQVKYTPAAPPVAVTPPAGTTVETTYQTLVERKGEIAAKSILTVVQSLVKDPADQTVLLWKAVVA